MSSLASKHLAARHESNLTRPRHWIVSDEHIWRNIAYAWGLLESPTSPVPTWKTEDMFLGHAHATYDSLASATGYFDEVTTYESLCRHHARLTSAWDASSSFVEHLMAPPAKRHHPSPTGLLSNEEYLRDARITGTSRSGELYLALFETRATGRHVSRASITARGKFSGAVTARSQPLRVPSKIEMPDPVRLSHRQLEDIFFEITERHTSDGRLLQALEVWKNAGDHYEIVGELTLPTSSEAVTALGMRYPDCVALSYDGGGEYYCIAWDLRNFETYPILVLTECDEVSAIDFDRSANLLFVTDSQDVQIYSLVDGSLLASWVCLPLDFEVPSLGTPALEFEAPWYLQASQIWLGTTYLSHSPITLPKVELTTHWRALEQTALAPVTLGRSYIWGITLLRPYSKMIDPRGRHLIRVAILHYHVFGESIRDVKNVWFRHQATANSRICQVMSTEGTSSKRKKEHVFVIDLDSRRLDTHKTVREHPFEDVKVWHIQTRVFRRNDSRHTEFWSDRLLDLHLDATTLWTNHYNAGLEYIDIGCLAKFSRHAPAVQSANDSAEDS
ncbi:WD40/YVTN repeat-like-containing domain [Ceraceosorus bombacis]|uniref:WD40/YVTN repeat-like-containing domain n=1 Tax=Ceraceosorus bombacis TaxID=401625 RepID=A0A0N7L9V2_9BASI|nr:WD40/YVTN repeat-like-containing domain [Ceraceosorus bombacis]